MLIDNTLLREYKIIKPLEKGWSSDKKYYAETEDGKKHLLRISDISEYSRKKREFENVKKLSAAGIKMSYPIGFGICNGGKHVYQILSWCEGEEAKEVLSDLTDAEQYAYGQKAAKTLKQMESVNHKPPSMGWLALYKQRVEHYIELYKNCGVTFPDDGIILDYLQTHDTCIGERPTALMHEDFQTDNMVISPDGELSIIDFQMCGETDPYLVMTGAGVSAEFSPAFAMGQMDEYFVGPVPDDFWDKYNYYMVAEMLYAFTVAVTIEEEKEAAFHMFEGEVLRIKNDELRIPKWYRK